MHRDLTFRVGDWVQVRSLNDVLATLDSEGSLDALPFMPEMVQYCGRRFKVTKSAHKPCDPTGCTNLRRMVDAVHLDTRCDGSAHDGCEARCLLFWKTAWLMRVDGPGADEVIAPAADSSDLDRLQAATRSLTSEPKEIRYRCQATEIVRATTVLPSLDLRQYAEDLATKNVGVADFIRYAGIAVSKMVISGLAKLVGLRRNRPTPSTKAKTSESLNLQPGEVVEIRSAKEIIATLNSEWKNRGLSLEKEMLRYCGGTYRVMCRVNRIIDERSGKMLKLANECIVLQGLQCAGLENRNRLFCTRSPYFYWREAWLRRVKDSGP
jgi:hypothetical protein